MARLHDSRHGSDADGIDDDDMPLTHEQAVVEADAELRRMTYHPVRKAVGIVVAMGVAIGASLGCRVYVRRRSGRHRDRDHGRGVPAGRQIRPGRRRAVCQHVRHLGASRPRGPGSARRDAGQYYLEAVKPSIQPLRDAMNTLYGGDLKATRAAAGKAATVLRATAKALRSRTWPDEVANAAAVVANEYDAKARQASYVADSVTPSASDELISLDAYGVSEADVYLRGKLGLPAAEAPSAPLEITGIEDRGIQQGADAGGSTVDTGKRIIAVTVRSHVPGTLSGLNLTFDLKKGKTTLGRISGIMDDIALAEGQSIVVPVPVDIGGDDGGIAGATMSWDSWSLTDWRGESHIAAASDDFAEYAPDKVMGTFTLR